MNKYKSVPKGTIRFVVLNSSVTWKDESKAKKFVEPYVIINYGDRQVKGIFDQSYNTKKAVKAADEQVKQQPIIGKEAMAINQVFKFNTDQMKSNFQLEFWSLPYEEQDLMSKNHYLVSRLEVDIHKFIKDVKTSK